MRFKSGHEIIEELNKFIENDMFNEALALAQTFSIEGCIDLEMLVELKTQWEDLVKEKADSPIPGKNYTLEFRRLRNKYFDIVDKEDCFQIEIEDESENIWQESKYREDFDKLLQKSSEAVNIFISYAHEDIKVLKKLHTAFGNMKFQKLIEVWDDGEIGPGISWEPEIFEKIECADIALLLISPSFTSSSYCMKKELDVLLARHSEQEGALYIIPVYLMDGEYKDAPFRKFQWLPRKKQFIDSYRNQQRGFNEVAKELRERVERIFERKNRKKIDAESVHLSDYQF